MNNKAGTAGAVDGKANAVETGSGVAAKQHTDAIVNKKQKGTKFMLVLMSVLTGVLTIVCVVLVFHIINLQPDEPGVIQNEENGEYAYTLEVTRQFNIPALDLRGFPLDHFQAEEWFLERINYHREAYGLHPYQLYLPATITSIEHSLDMRDNEFAQAAASDGRTHQERHDRWMGDDRTKVTSAHTSTHEVAGELTQAGVNEIVDRIFERERSRAFLLNPTYYYIGIGFSVQVNGTGRLSITMASQADEREAHRARTREERIEHRENYLERVRAERGWTGDAD